MDKSILEEELLLKNKDIIEQHEVKIDKMMFVITQLCGRVESIVTYLTVMFRDFGEDFKLINIEMDKKRQADYEQLMKAEAMEAANSE